MVKESCCCCCRDFNLRASGRASLRLLLLRRQRLRLWRLAGQALLRLRLLCCDELVDLEQLVVALQGDTGNRQASRVVGGVGGGDFE